MRGAEWVEDVEALEAEDAQPPAGKVKSGGAAHPAETQDDDVESLGHEAFLADVGSGLSPDGTSASWGCRTRPLEAREEHHPDHQEYCRDHFPDGPLDPPG